MESATYAVIYIHKLFMLLRTSEVRASIYNCVSPTFHVVLCLLYVSQDSELFLKSTFIEQN